MKLPWSQPNYFGLSENTAENQHDGASTFLEQVEPSSKNSSLAELSAIVAPLLALFVWGVDG